MVLKSRALPRAEIKRGVSVMASAHTDGDVGSVGCIAGEFCRFVAQDASSGLNLSRWLCVQCCDANLT